MAPHSRVKMRAAANPRELATFLKEIRLRTDPATLGLPPELTHKSKTTQRDAALAIPISETHWGMFEQGKACPSEETIRRIVEVFHLSEAERMAMYRMIFGYRPVGEPTRLIVEPHMRTLLEGWPTLPAMLTGPDWELGGCNETFRKWTGLKPGCNLMYEVACSPDIHKVLGPEYATCWVDPMLAQLAAAYDYYTEPYRDVVRELAAQICRDSPAARARWQKVANHPVKWAHPHGAVRPFIPPGSSEQIAVLLMSSEVDESPGARLTVLQPLGPGSWPPPQQPVTPG